MEKKKKNKKRFKETKVGIFLKDKAPTILDTVGEFLPDQGGLGIVKNLISGDSNIEPKDKEMALKLLDQDIAEMNNISNRWQSDMTSDSWLSNLAMTIFIVLDSTVVLEINNGWVSLLEALLITVYVAYFGSRGAEKIQKLRK
jgi:hypothetical protein